MAKLIWTSEAERWLRDIYDYIAQDDAVAASNVINGIYEKAQIFRAHPEIGYQYEFETEKEIRILLYGHYRITYTYIYDEVVILGVFHGALQIQKYLEK